MAARTTSPALTPALIAKMSPGGRGARGALNYDAEKDGSRLLWTNLEGTTPRQWARQMKAFLSLNPRCRRSVDHVSLSLDPRRGTLSDDQWIVAVKAWLKPMGYGDRAAVCHLHSDEPQQHIHLVVCRTDSFGKVHADGGNWKRSHAAAVHAAEAIGLKPLPPRPEAAWSPAPTDAQIGANKRADRRGTKVQNHASLARAFDHIVSKSSTLAELEVKLREVDIEIQIVRKSGGVIQGLNVREAGAVEWEKASGLKSGRSLGWPKVEARLAANVELHERARAQAEKVADAARDRAEQRVAARLDKPPAPPAPVPQPARALVPEAIREAKEAITMDDDLAFLNSPPPPRPANVPLDDAGLVPTLTGSVAAGGEAEARHKKKLEAEQEGRDRDQAELELIAEIRCMSIRQLLDLKSNSNVPPFFLSAAAIEKMVNLLILLATLGFVRRVDTLAAALAARDKLRAYAEAELDARRRSQPPWPTAKSSWPSTPRPRKSAARCSPTGTLFVQCQAGMPTNSGHAAAPSCASESRKRSTRSAPRPAWTPSRRAAPRMRTRAPNTGACVPRMTKCRPALAC